MNPQDIITQGRAQMVTALNVGHLSEAEQNEIIDSLGEVLFKRVLVALLDRLPETEAERYSQLTQAGQHEAAQALVTKHVPNYAEIVNETLQSGLAEYVQHVNASASGQSATA